MRTPSRREFPTVRLFLVTLAAVSLAACAASRPALESTRKPDAEPARQTAEPAPAATTPTAADLADRSVLRLRLDGVAAQAWRLVDPHWSRVPDYQRGALQAALLQVFNEETLLPPAVDRLATAIKADPEAATETMQWLRSPLADELKFAEATASRGGATGRQPFLEQYARLGGGEGADQRTAEVRELARATGAVAAALDVTEAIGMTTAELINSCVPEPQRVSDGELATEVRHERQAPDLAATYEPVVIAGLLYRYRELKPGMLEQYVAFARTEAGRWYHRALTDALVAALRSAARGTDQVILANAGARPVFDPEATALELPSGGHVRVLGVSGIEIDAKPALVLRYETSLTLKDAVAVRDEADEVWEQVRRELESTGTGAAVLQATGSVKGWVFPSASTRSFAWTRQRDGDWKALSARDVGFGEVRRQTLWSLSP